MYLQATRRNLMAKFKTFLYAIPLGIAGAGAVTIAARYFREIHAARQRLDNMGSQVIETDCGPIEYARIGDGYPLLVVHGAMGGFDQGLWVAQSLDVSAYQLISVSRFGYLRSPLPANANLDLQADIYAGLLDALGIRQAAVFGISAGSTSAIRFVARHPERVSALVLLGPDAPGGVYMTMPPRFILDRLLRSDFLWWALETYFWKSVQKAIGLVPKGFVLTPEYDAMLKKFQTGDLPVSRRMDGLVFESYDLLPEFFASVSATSPYPLSQIETPVLVISALDDPIARAENVRALAEKMPNAHLFVVPEGGHFFFGHAEEVKAEITRFLRDNAVVLNSSH
jgi:pimeloyl-ACP methyl ester carboxylesterase